jgi:p24 family protein delta-1
MVIVTIPSEDDTDEQVENWYVDQIYELTKLKDQHKVLPKALIKETPTEIKEKESTFLKTSGGNDAKLKFQVTGTPTSDPTNYVHTYNTRFFQFNVLNYVGRTTLARLKQYRKGEANVNLEGYGVCLTNEHESRPVQVVFDIVLISEVIINDDDNAGGFQKEKHLTPLEQSLEQSIDAANTVLREMKYMEKREQRMRQTAESINSRVRWFSYLSISVLLSVTYIQVTYLKRYFHKKKLM